MSTINKGEHRVQNLQTILKRYKIFEEKEEIIEVQEDFSFDDMMGELSVIKSGPFKVWMILVNYVRYTTIDEYARKEL